MWRMSSLLTSARASKALGAPSTRSHGSQPSCFLAYLRRGFVTRTPALPLPNLRGCFLRSLPLPDLRGCLDILLPDEGLPNSASNDCARRTCDAVRVRQ